jgi:hypothetical protein
VRCIFLTLIFLIPVGPVNSISLFLLHVLFNRMNAKK